MNIFLLIINLFFIPTITLYFYIKNKNIKPLNIILLYFIFVTFITLLSQCVMLLLIYLFDKIVTLDGLVYSLISLIISLIVLYFSNHIKFFYKNITEENSSDETTKKNIK